jgi:hypothetical protein
MRQKIRLALLVLILMAVAVPLTAHAAVVGRFTQVRGEVNLLKGGKIPARLVKVQDGVEPGDIIRTKAKAKAELTMVDDSVIILAPESRLAIADYVYKPDLGERRAVLRFFKGLVHTVVKRVIKTQEPDFIMETHTAIIGVRGTDWFTLLMPGFTSVYLKHGLLGITSNIPTIPALLLLHGMQFTQIPLGGQPFLGKPLTPEMLRSLERMMDTGVQEGALWLGPTKVPAGTSQFPFRLPVSPEQQVRQQTVPPTLQPPHLMPAPPPTPTSPSSPPSGSGSYIIAP